MNFKFYNLNILKPSKVAKLLVAGRIYDCMLIFMASKNLCAYSHLDLDSRPPKGDVFLSSDRLSQ